MKELTIGKLPDNHIVIDNKMVSRHHAKIIMDKGGRFELVDLGSKNGTYVNGRKVRGSQAIRPGDRIVFATSNIPYCWERLFDQIPDDEPDPIVNIQPGSNSVDPSVLSSVLYDFGKDVDAMFAKQCEYLKQIFTDFKDNRIPPCRPVSVNHFSEEILDLLVDRYIFVGKQLSLLLNTLERENASFQEEYAADMQKLDTTYQYFLRNSKGETDLTANLNRVDARKNEMKLHFAELRKAVLPGVVALIEEYYAQNPPLFTNRFELAPADAALWKSLPVQNEEIQKTFYLGDDVTRYTILQEPVELKKRVYVHSLYGGNLLFKYTPKYRQSCFDAVNALICRMLASAPSGKVQVVMVDFNEMEGTCGTFNGLNKSVFRVISRNDEFTNMLNAEVSRTENIIQNLFQGETTNIAEYNRTKTEKVAYTLWVFKNISTGRGNDFAEKLAKIMRNGPRAGVSVLVLWDDEMDIQSDESKVAVKGWKNVLDSVPVVTVDFAQESSTMCSCKMTKSMSFAPDTISSIVKKINQGLEVKTETILKYTEYMLPEKDWWLGDSAKRIDLPFGLSEEMKTTALQITQESGQNSAVVIGIPGSGKSVFLHSIIASAITHYSPKELQIYLLDFSGVEFDVYARHNLPHARVIAPEAEREFGLSILREVFEEGNRRMALCRENGVTNIVELKRTNPDAAVPRLLVIIDEFQKLFEVENDIISKDANAKIHAIIQEYRKFGINLILATQKLPAKSMVPYDLIANRVVFKSDPNDFNNLIKWPYSKPQPRLQTGTCVYNNESGAEVANNVTHSYFINASKELEDLLDKVAVFAKVHPEMMDGHKLRTFRSNELPEFSNRRVAESHRIRQEFPREVGIYLGESISIADLDVHVPLTTDSNNNILIIGGEPNVAKSIACFSMVSAIGCHTEKSCSVNLLNFMMEDDPVQGLFRGEWFSGVPEYCNLQEARSADEVKNQLQAIKEQIETRKNDSSLPLSHIFLDIFEFQRGRMFDGTGPRGDMPSECTRLLEFILKNGPMVGVFTILQVDNIDNLKKIAYSAQNLFCHRIALQMPEQESDKIVGSTAANKLLVLNRPATKYRALYYNNIKNSTTKFKPYRL